MTLVTFSSATSMSLADVNLELGKSFNTEEGKENIMFSKYV